MGLEQSLALGVILASHGVVVPRGPVGLDDQATPRPPKVGNDLAVTQVDRDVDIGVFEPGGSDQVEDYVLEKAPGRSGTFGDDPAKLASPASVA